MFVLACPHPLRSIRQSLIYSVNVDGSCMPYSSRHYRVFLSYTRSQTVWSHTFMGPALKLKDNILWASGYVATSKPSRHKECKHRNCTLFFCSITIILFKVSVIIFCYTFHIIIYYNICLYTI